MTDEWSGWPGVGSERFRLSNRDQALLLVHEYDLEAQLIAIKGVLSRNREAEERVSEAIQALDARIPNYGEVNEEYLMHMENHWVDTLHGTVFQDAAHSMSAVGMLAPFLESLLVSIFAGFRDRWEDDWIAVSDAIRGPSSADKFWLPNSYIESGEMAERHRSRHPAAFGHGRPGRLSPGRLREGARGFDRIPERTVSPWI